jgi:hypothetical protein
VKWAKAAIEGKIEYAARGQTLGYVNLGDERESFGSEAAELVREVLAAGQGGSGRAP